MTEQEMMDWIDKQPYVELLRKWRFAKIGDPFFQRGPVFDHYDKVMKEKKQQIGDLAAVKASKQVGWSK